jgi:hypothetical protein
LRRGLLRRRKSKPRSSALPKRKTLLKVIQLLQQEKEDLSKQNIKLTSLEICQKEIQLVEERAEIPERRTVLTTPAPFFSVTPELLGKE